MRNASQVFLAILIFCTAACHAAEPVEMSADWPKKFLNRWSAPASLSGPVDLVWEMGRRDGGVMGYPGGSCALVSDRTSPAKMMCIELDTGHVRWTTADWTGSTLIIDNLLFSQKASTPQEKPKDWRNIQLKVSYGIISCQNGSVVKETEAADGGIPPRIEDLSKLRKRMNAAKNPQLAVIKDSRELLNKTFYSPDPTKSLPSGKVDGLTHSEIKQILDAVKVKGLPHHGASKGFVIPNANQALLMGFSGELQLYEDLSKDPIWSVKLSQSPDPRLAYTDDLCLAVGDGYKITAVHTDTGKTAWEYESEVKGVYGAPVRELVVLEDGFLFFTDPLEEPEDANTRNIAMTKLDKKGRVQFQQSLPSRAHYPKIYFSGQYLLIQSGGHVACYRSKSKQAVKPAE